MNVNVFPFETRPEVLAGVVIAVTTDCHCVAAGWLAGWLAVQQQLSSLWFGWLNNWCHCTLTGANQQPDRTLSAQSQPFMYGAGATPRVPHQTVSDLPEWHTSFSPTAHRRPNAPRSGFCRWSFVGGFCALDGLTTAQVCLDGISQLIGIWRSCVNVRNRGLKIWQVWVGKIKYPILWYTNG